MTTVTEDHADEVGLRERKKLQTRTAIHDAAYRLIYDQGLEATTIEQICQEADVSTRTFFNYYPSKAAAALELPGTGIDEDVQKRFRSARGNLVTALCSVIGSSAEIGPDHARMKRLIVHRPELVTTMSQIMMEVRGKYVSLAAERASSQARAELAVALVFTALGRVMHEEDDSDATLTDRLRETVQLLVGVAGDRLEPISRSS